MIVTIASWYLAALLRAGVHIGSLLALVITTGALVEHMINVALLTFFAGTGASHFLTS